MSTFYTQSERIDKKYPIEQAVDFAFTWIKSKTRNPKPSLNLSSIRGRDRTEKVTVVELNELMNNIVTDTLSNV